MPKTKRGKKSAGASRLQATRPSAQVSASPTRAQPSPTIATVNRRLNKNSASWQNLLFPVMVALGCWGMAASFVFFYTADPNHNLYAGMAVIMALIWTFSAVQRVRKMLEARRMIGNNPG